MESKKSTIDYLNKSFLKKQKKDEIELLSELENAINKITRTVNFLNNETSKHKEKINRINEKREVFAAKVVDAEIQEEITKYTEMVKRHSDVLLEAASFVFENQGAAIASKPFDISDPDFQNVLNVINATGKNLPASFQEQFVEKYKDNITALSLLESVYKRQNFNLVHIRDKINNYKSGVNEIALENIIRNAASSAYNGQWKPPHNADVEAVRLFGLRYNLNLAESVYVTKMKKAYGNDPEKNAFIEKAVEAIETAERENPESVESVFNTYYRSL